MPDAEPGDDIVVDLDWRVVLVALAAFVGLVALTGLVRSAPQTLAFVAVGTLVALALDPVVSAVQRRLRLRRWLAVMVVLVLVAAVIAVLALLLVPRAARQAGDLGRELPEVVASLGDLPVVGDELEENDVPRRVEEWLEELPARLSGDPAGVVRAARRALSGAVTAVATFLVTVSLLVDGHRLVAFCRRLVPPAYEPRADRVADVLYRVVGRYFAGSLLVAVLAGLVTLAAGLTLGVPLTPLAAVWVMVWNLVPQIGGAVGGVPFVLLGLTQGPGVALAAGVFFVLYLQFENHLLTPLVVGQAVDLSPPVTMVAALVGVSGAGVVGALVAVPLVGAAKALYVELRPRPAGNDFESGAPPSVPST